jgi:GR25 family glycosyltransferase involved in LPS biosynthesis
VKPSEVKHPESWTFFDKIYCISLDTRIDRREQVKKQFAELGFLDRVEFVIVAKHATNQEKGIYQSHMKCLNKGIESGAQHILVFEDDVFFERFDPHALRRTCRYLEKLPTWNALFLGCMIDGSSRTDEKNLKKITHRTLAHAYALNRPFAQTLAQKKWNGTPFDEFLRLHNNDYYAIYPMCAFQGLSGTDNRRVAIDRIRRLLGGLPFIQKVNELYHNHTIPLLSLTVGVILGGAFGIALLAYKIW